MKPSERWRSFVQYYAERAGLPPDLCFRQMMQESSGNPRAVSPVGAKGLFQLMPGACSDTGVADPMDPDQNVRGGTEYLARQIANVRLALEGVENPVGDDTLRFGLAAYNCGFGYVKAALREVRARQLPTTWQNFKRFLPNVTVRGKRPDWKQATHYAETILPPTP